MIKVAIPTKDNMVNDHFGHCEYYTVFTIDESNQIKSSETVPSPQGCGCKSNIAATLESIGVSVMLAGNIGQGALNVLTAHNIKVVRGCSGDVTAVVATYLEGKIADSGTSCKSHEHKHECQHGHCHEHAQEHGHECL